MTLLERLEEILKENDWTAREWAQRAGLSEATHLYTAMRRLKKKPDSKMDLETLAALSDAAGVTLEWLALGRLPKRSIIGPPDPRYPSRSQAVAAARLMGLDDTAIEAVATVDDLGADPGAEYWLQRIMLTANERKLPRLLPARVEG